MRDLLHAGRCQRCPNHLVRFLVLLRIWVRIQPHLQGIERLLSRKPHGLLERPALVEYPIVQHMVALVLCTIEAVLARLFNHGQSSPGEYLCDVLVHNLGPNFELPLQALSFHGREIQVLRKGQKWTGPKTLVVRHVFPEIRKQLVPPFDEGIPFACRNPVICKKRLIVPRYADLLRVAGVFELVPAHAVELSDQDDSNIHPNATMQVQQSTTKQIRSMRSLVWSVHRTLDQCLWEHLRRDVFQDVVR